jgi:hypothetical protein
MAGSVCEAPSLPRGGRLAQPRPTFDREEARIQGQFTRSSFAVVLLEGFDPAINSSAGARGGGSMPDDWDKVEDAALKVLGDGGGVPEFDVPLKAFASFTDDWRDKLVPAADKVSAAIFTLQQNASSRSELWEELQDRVDASDLGLNAKKNKADARPIADAKKLLDGFLKKQMAEADAEMKQLREAHKVALELKAHFSK